MNGVIMSGRGVIYVDEGAGVLALQEPLLGCSSEMPGNI